jgi:hypothetical protein
MKSESANFHNLNIRPLTKKSPGLVLSGLQFAAHRSAQFQFYFPDALYLILISYPGLRSLRSLTRGFRQLTD